MNKFTLIVVGILQTWVEVSRCLNCTLLVCSFAVYQRQNCCLLTCLISTLKMRLPPSEDPRAWFYWLWTVKDGAAASRFIFFISLFMVVNDKINNGLCTVCIYLCIYNVDILHYTCIYMWRQLQLSNSSTKYYRDTFHLLRFVSKSFYCHSVCR